VFSHFYGLVIPTTKAPYPVCGIVQQASHGHAVVSYLVALAAMLFTAATCGKMSGAYPAAGSTYTYAQRALNPHVGFLRATRFSPLLLTRDLSSIARKQDLRRSATAQAVDFAWRSFGSSNLVWNGEGSAVLLL
jgi:amino acid transporter